MLIQKLPGREPRISPLARGAGNCAVIGDVTIGQGVSLWYSCTLRGDEGSITIGDGSNVQDGCVLHCGPGFPITVGRDVVIGHNATVHGCTIEDGCLIGMGSTVMDGAVIGAGSLVGAGALVTQGKQIPPGSLVIGVPAKVVRQLTEEEQEHIRSKAAYYVRLSQEGLPPALDGEV